MNACARLRRRWRRSLIFSNLFGQGRRNPEQYRSTNLRMTETRLPEIRENPENRGAPKTRRDGLQPRTGREHVAEGVSPRAGDENNGSPNGAAAASRPQGVSLAVFQQGLESRAKVDEASCLVMKRQDAASSLFGCAGVGARAAFSFVRWVRARGSRSTVLTTLSLTSSVSHVERSKGRRSLAFC